MADTFNFGVDQGSDCEVEITFRPGGEDFDFTGFTIQAMLRRQVHSDVALTLTSQGVSPTITVAGPVVTLIFLGTATAALIDTYFYDVVATSSSAKRRIVEGKVTFTPAITRSA